MTRAQHPFESVEGTIEDLNSMVQVTSKTKIFWGGKTTEDFSDYLGFLSTASGANQEVFIKWVMPDENYDPHSKYSSKQEARVLIDFLDANCSDYLK